MTGAHRTEPEPEGRLIEAARAGDTEAFDRLVLRYQNRLYRTMVRTCHHPDDAEEVAVEAFAQAYERLRQFEGRSSFVTWLSRIAANLCFRRRERPEPQFTSLDRISREGEDHPGAALPAPGPTPEEAALQAEMRRTIRAAIAGLPDRDRDVVQLRDIEGLSAQETAARLGLTVPAVKARLHRARARLRETLNAGFFGDE